MSAPTATTVPVVDAAAINTVPVEAPAASGTSVSSVASVASVASAVATNTDIQMNKSNDGPSVYDSVEVTKDSIRQVSAQIAKTTIQLVTPGSIPAADVMKVRAALALQQKDLVTFKDSFLTMEEALRSPVVATAPAPAPAPTVDRMEAVPKDLPVIQWVGMVSDIRSTIFTDLRACLSRFEVVVECHGLNLDTHGARLLKYACLHEAHQTFVNDNFFVPGALQLDWADIKAAFLKKFGVNASVDKATAANELMSISERSSETVEQYIDRFNALRRRANLNDSCLLVSNFLRGLPDAFHEGMAYTLNNASEAQNQNLEYVCAVARNLDSRLAPMRANNKRSGDSSKESTDNKKLKVSGADSSPSFPNGAAASKYASSASSSSSRRKENSDMFCSFHPTRTHNTVCGEFGVQFPSSGNTQYIS